MFISYFRWVASTIKNHIDIIYSYACFYSTPYLLLFTAGARINLSTSRQFSLKAPFDEVTIILHSNKRILWL